MYRDRLDLFRRDLRMKLERRGDRRLRVIFREEVLELRLGDAVRTSFTCERRDLELADELPQALRALDRPVRPGHALLRHERGENAVARGVSGRTTFPHR